MISHNKNNFILILGFLFGVLLMIGVHISVLHFEFKKQREVSFLEGKVQGRQEVIDMLQPIIIRKNEQIDFLLNYIEQHKKHH